MEYANQREYPSLPVVGARGGKAIDCEKRKKTVYYSYEQNAEMS